MRLKANKSLSFLIFLLGLPVAIYAQEVEKELQLAAGSNVTIINRTGRVSVVAGSSAADRGKVIASGPKGVASAELKVLSSTQTLSIDVVAAEPRKRIDLAVTLPERCNVFIETDSGQVAVSGNFASITAKTGTGTIVTDIPDNNISYILRWTESRPRVVSDFDLAEVREKTGGKFEIRGERTKKDRSVPDTSVTLSFTTARGIVLVNVPPNEVGADLRERPLSDAAKAIVRSGDSLLMEAIRRAAPKYYGEYARSLPPYKREPIFAERVRPLDSGSAELKTALVRVTDLRNRAIAGLKASDFVVTESGTEREVVSVSASTAPFNLVLLLDVSGSVENYVTFIRKAARAFVDTVDKQDRVSIVIFNDDVKVLSRFTTDKGQLSQSLDTFDAGGGTAYFDALAYTVAETLRPLKGERTAIVVLTDGEDNRSFLAFDSLTGSIQESGALIYPLYVPNGLIAQATAGNAGAGEIDPMRLKYMSLSSKAQGEGEKLARISGGVYYPITRIEQIQLAYEDIVLQLRTAYNVTFRSDSLMNGNVSTRLKIKAKRENAYASITSVISAQ